MTRRRAGGGLVLAAVLAAAGCGGQKFHPVSGQLVFPDGRPVTGLAGGLVTFEGTGPDGKNYSSSGPVDGEGKFTLTTERAGDGAVAGTNKVSIVPAGVGEDHPPPKVVDRKYESVTTSPLDYEVKPGPNPDVKITVEPFRR